MATISLYKNKINGVGGLIDSIVKSSNKLDTQLGTLRNTLQGVDSSTCNLQDVVSSISSSSKSEQEKVADLKRLNSKLTDFITMTSRRDAAVKTAVERSKTDFYSKYSYLKPECEKNVFEHICDGLQTAGEWCKEHWKLIVTVVIVVVAVVLLCTGVGSGLGAVLLAGACWGAIMGACIGGVAGGIGSMMNGGSFLSGFEDGAFSGAIGGAIGGAVSAGLGAAIGPALTFTGSIVRGAAIGAASSGVSNMGVSTINYLIENKTFEGSGNVIISSGISGIISGGITGGIMGALTFQSPSSTVQSLQSNKVWDDITPTQPNYPGTEIPRSFVIKTDGETLWVHGNATEHMAEYLIKQANTGYSQSGTNLSAQIMLYDMQQSLGTVTKNGIVYGKILHHGNWDFIINKARNGESYDAVIHALIKK